MSKKKNKIISSAKELISEDEKILLKTMAAMDDDEFDYFIKLSSNNELNELYKFIFNCAFKYSEMIKNIELHEKDVERFAEIISREKLKNLAYNSNITSIN